METKETTTFNHVKGSEITGTWARDLEVDPNSRYDISVRLDKSLLLLKQELMVAPEQDKGV